ncbi:dihydrolipoyl dehydrogenase family protein [Streptomyces lividans]|uniref:PF00070 family, FAD-dependent NAD(P)-disulfide oxidoreductase n=4 Tax=Streptomyces TaxID=1883 RepID=A0A7U9H9M4_STRLI|nr:MULTISPECIES: NAD(P)/FAD-dependent oxidoreductase [Streptomyces]QSJ13198.1 oxidoreductase [Streptomyces lividans]AIJ17587.1 oxidoreductase [Streptomyces lividans TK24]EFD71072.1 oxidoreductase [Streptomyces lividans TK24]EOY45828.1 PF00070 family, FAD-dependent NAD(P)-disulfide oxidoreductase [Streptomyces lividans 1326]KKD10640.1 pyridine nucleotide-disulfide oxidoreductase [Streptomyces sp. WM6391]
MTQSDSLTYDVVVIGAGPVGENVADRTRAAGLSTAIVESELVGGECSYWACMPSKALLRPVLARADARRLPGLAQSLQEPLDATAVLARRDEFTSHWKDDGQVQWVEGIGADLYRGQGRLAGPRTVEVAGPDGTRRTLTARHAVAVCTGSAAALPPLPGLAEVRPWTSREATSAERAPGRLIVVGAGVVAVEMATAWQALGSRVTMLVRGDGGLLARMEPFAGELVAESLTEAGVDIRTGVSVESVTRENGTVVAVTDTGDRLEADEILFATGRTPRTGDIGLDTVGLKPGSWLPVDDSLRVEGSDWLYAVGDVNHRALLTHQGKYQARIAGAAIAARASGVPILESDPWGAHAATADHDAVPQVVFTDPEVASVGLTLAEAEQAGHRVRAVDVPIAVAGSSLYGDGYKGRARMVVDLEDEIVRGVTFVGPGVGEMIHSATIAVAGRVPISRLWHAVPSYPTISEVWLRLLETYRDN